MTILLIFLIGCITGILSGLLGIGGGVVLVPMLIFFLGFSQHMAQGISLLFIIPTAIAGLVQFHRDKLVDYRVAAYLAAGAIVGALLSANLAQNIPADDLKRLFGIFVIYTGIRMILAKPKK